jgi:hypothetical protein
LPDEFVYAYLAFDFQSPSEVANIIHLALQTLIDRPRQQTFYKCDTVHKAIS